MTDDPGHYDDLAARHVSIRRVLRLFVPYRARIGAVVALMILASAIGLAGPFLLRAIIDIALPQQDLSLLAWLAGGMIAAALASAGIGALQIVLSARICPLCPGLRISRQAGRDHRARRSGDHPPVRHARRGAAGPCQLCLCGPVPSDDR
ncbi:hypothetical protein [Rhodovulum sp. BSW8]|uniref:hypothetical protein n=1 Tax=Rhodovulum sp. BSW8 TaxID=2259645 RepID=UPI001058A964|nr:hypothetical protein [Rhodovulum sp. BSW8]